MDENYRQRLVAYDCAYYVIKQLTCVVRIGNRSRLRGSDERIKDSKADIDEESF